MIVNQKKMKFLIPTEPDDTQAVLVKLVLESIGYDAQLLFTADQPTIQKNSVYIDNEHAYYKSLDDENAYTDQTYDVVWWRRPRKPFIPKDMVHSDDYKFVVRENILFFESITYNIASNAWWINTKEGANRANIKLLQLKIARDCGLSIPTTLFSNDPKEIREFCLLYDDEGVIYKPICSNFWFEEGSIKIAYTAKIGFLDLPRNKLLQTTPGIFQKEIKKKYELRVTCFGDYIVAAKLNSQTHPKGQVDWRAIPDGQLQVEPYQLPTEIENKLRIFMRKIGIVFGCFDFIVTHEDEYIFLEVNEQGQFLWLEEYNPDIKMLDIFTQFLLIQKREFCWNSKQATFFIENYRDDIQPILSRNMRIHVDLNSSKTYQP